MSIKDKKDQEIKNDKKNQNVNEDKKIDDYSIPKETLNTVFEDKKDDTLKIEIDDSEEVIPQNNEKYQVKSQIITKETDRLAPMNVSDEMRKSFLEYAMSVIVDRALPDSRDGLKPVHRRILYDMYELGLTSRTSYKKSARIVGDVLGKYHPHGDASVYEAMVRLSQNFSMRYPMVDGHGNFGSIDGDGAAAMRYTEVRMSRIAETMVDGIKKDTVNFVSNYDDSEIEPVVLPSRIPNLLISGSTGIAVGMATSIPPHNLKNVIEAVIAFAKNKDISIEELIDLIEGPDFPTGGIIIGSSGFKEAYHTGRGSVKVRSKTHIEKLKNGKKRIIVTEIPFMVNKANMIEKIAILVKQKKIKGITDLRDETSRKGIRIVIELRKDVIPEVIQNILFKKTQMQSNFSMNMIALVNKEPKIMNLQTILSVYLNHQKNVVKRRTIFDLKKSEKRKHILDGLKIATKNIEEFIKIIKSSNNDEEAQTKLIQTYNISKIQAKAITDMRLGRLTGLAIEKMNEEIIDLEKIIKELMNILENENVLIDLIIKELSDIKKIFEDKRRTEINNSIGDILDEDLIPKKNVAVIMSNRGYVKRISLENYKLQNRGGIGSQGMKTYDDDDVEKIISTNTHTDLLIFTNFGKVYRIRVHQIPESSKIAKGTHFVNIIPIQKEEKIASLLAIEKYKDEESLLTVTQKGIVKKTAINHYSKINISGKIALKIKKDDYLVKAMLVKDNHQIIIGSSFGQVVKFQSTQIRRSGRVTSGVKGINLKGKLNAKVIGAFVTENDGFILSCSVNGFGKQTPINEYNETKRGAKGVKSIDVKKAGYLKFIKFVKGDEDVLAITKNGITIRTNLSQVATSHRSTKGVKIISLKKGDKIKSIAIINFQDVAEKVEEKNL